ncbi:MAG: GAF domain-containing protein [Actinobacteria bacterium]|nr:GAF domain-containing protein [Actinomycetota bacterium]
MSGETRAIVLNGVPLALVAALYTAVAMALGPSIWRERHRVSALGLAFLSLFPVLAVLTSLVAGFVLVQGEPFGGHIWVGLGAIVLAALPPLAVLVQGRRGTRLIGAWARSGEVEARAAFLDRELDSVAAVSNQLARAREPVGIARVLLGQVASMLGVDLALLVRVDEIGGEARGVLGLSGGKELDWVRSLRLDLAEPSGIAQSVRERRPIAVDDAEASPIVHKGLVQQTGAKSIVFVPLLIGRKPTGVLVAVDTSRNRTFQRDEIAVLQTLAAEGALALDRVRFASELAEALERERIVARIARKVRSELDLDAVLEVAVSETGRALGVSRCFIRLGMAGEEMTIGAEWDDVGVASVGHLAERLPVANLAMHRRETVAIADGAVATELDVPELGGRQVLQEIGARAVLATPIAVFDRMIGIFVLQRPEPGPWPEEEIKLAEAVAREVGLAMHAARLLRESEVRLDHLSTLIKAAQVVSAELRLETVLQRLVQEVTSLLDADAADCYLHDVEKGVIRCAAVHGLDESMVGFEAPRDRGLAGLAFQERRSVVSHDYDQLAEAFPNPAYEGFRAALVAPMTLGDEVLGVLGVGSRDESRRFGQADREAIEAFAGLATLAIRHAASFEDRERRSRIERGFYRVASALAQPLSLAETVDAVAQAACEALGGTFAAVLMPGGGGLTLAGRHELPDRVAERVSGLPPALADCSSRGLVVAAPDARSDTRLDDDWRALVPSQFRSLLAVPLDVGEELNGVALVFFEDERSFTDDDLELAGHLADAAKGALERGRLFERERSARRLSQQLARIGSFLATELDPARVIEEVVGEAPELLGADAAAIRLVEGDELVVVAGSGDGAKEQLGSRSPSGVGLAGEVTQLRAPVRVTDAHAGRAADPDPLLANAYDAYLGVPLSGAEGALLGVLSVYARGARRWRDDEVEALVALASNASTALSTAELYQRVAEEKERSETILAHVADGIVAVDREGCVVLWNEAASQITGIDRQDVLGRDPAEVLKRSFTAPDSHGGGPRILAIPRGEEEVWLSLSEAVMRDATGAVAGRIFAFRDVSAQRLVEQMKSDFVATVSQQLRAPLTSIYGFAETLLRHDVHFSDEERSTFLQYVASESERLTAIVDTLLNVARLEAGDLRVDLAPTDLHTLVADVVATADATALNGHEFVLELPDEPLVAQADDEKLRQALVNLVDNAVKYSPGGGRVVISVRRKNETGTVEVAVTDEGVGIPQAEQELIFSKFYRRADLAGQEGMGAGLGLFIAEGLLSAMGGSIRVSSVEGQGSSFAFELPLAQPVRAPELMSS